MKAAIVGLGGMGRHHLVDALKCKGVSAVAGCDVNPELCRKAEKDFGVLAFPDVPRLLRDWKPQAVVVATPPNHHAEVIRACVNAGVALLTEKPICSDLP
jgi:predicted dehydrogenase